MHSLYDFEYFVRSSEYFRVFVQKPVGVDCASAIHSGFLPIHRRLRVFTKTSPSFLKDAQKGYIVHGNSDPTELREALPYIEVFEVEGVKIGAIHPAWGGPEFPPEELFKDFDDVPDVILFGHTHVPMNRHIKNVLFVNPGQGYSSFMVDCTIAELTVRDGAVDSQIITIKKNTP